jgi:hypothetical protein
MCAGAQYIRYQWRSCTSSKHISSVRLVIVFIWKNDRLLLYRAARQAVGLDTAA